MNFDDFERESRRAFQSIPERFLEGIDGLTVHRKALPHPRFPGIYTLGECATESYLSDWEGPETVRSRILLYWGSFEALARVDPDFDWNEQIRETIDHELRHHLEWLAREDDYEGLDDAMEQEFRRERGLAFDPAYYRRGLQIGPNVFEIEDRVFIERSWGAEHFGRSEAIIFAWGGRRYEVPPPPHAAAGPLPDSPHDAGTHRLGAVHFVRIVDGIPAPPYLEIVLVRPPSWAERIRSLLGRRGEPAIYESDAIAQALSKSGTEEAE